MTNPFDGTWTMILGDQIADPAQNAKLVIAGGSAWYANAPDNVGACVVGDGGFVVTTTTPGANGEQWTETLLAYGDGAARSLSATLRSIGPDDFELSDPCTLLRGVDLHAIVPPAAAEIARLL